MIIKFICNIRVYLDITVHNKVNYFGIEVNDKQLIIHTMMHLYGTL